MWQGSPGLRRKRTVTDLWRRPRGARQTQEDDQVRRSSGCIDRNLCASGDHGLVLGGTRLGPPGTKPGGRPRSEPSAASAPVGTARRSRLRLANQPWSPGPPARGPPKSASRRLGTRELGVIQVRLCSEQAYLHQSRVVTDGCGWMKPSARGPHRGRPCALAHPQQRRAPPTIRPDIQSTNRIR
jgi:hypothetical protein